MSLSPTRPAARSSIQSPRRTTLAAAAASTTAAVTTASAGTSVGVSVGVSAGVGASTGGVGEARRRAQLVTGADNRYAVQLQRETEQMLRRQTNTSSTDQGIRTFSCRSVSLSVDLCFCPSL